MSNIDVNHLITEGLVLEPCDKILFKHDTMMSYLFLFKARCKYLETLLLIVSYLFKILL